MAEVAVRCVPDGDGWTCRVTVREDRSESEHEVAVSRSELVRLARTETAPDRLVELSFRYLLEREPKESILRRFSISEIELYFPGYPTEIARRLRSPSS